MPDLDNGHRESSAFLRDEQISLTATVCGHLVNAAPLRNIAQGPARSFVSGNTGALERIHNYQRQPGPSVAGLMQKRPLLHEKVET